MPFPVDESAIVAAEIKLKVRFPASFRNRMMQENGGEVHVGEDVWQLYPFLDTSDKKRLARTCNDIARETFSARSCSGFPAEAIAIASNGSGDYLVMLPKAESESELSSVVSFWDHESCEVCELVSDFSELE
jgi:hypothetical protein